MPLIVVEPQITIVIPAFNRAATIHACLQSVQGQTYADWEAVVVDDGSADQTSDVIASMARDDPRIRLIRLPRNQGAQTARNAGIRTARGPWVAFLDSDDRYLPESLEVRLAVATREHASVTHSSGLIARSSGQVEPYRRRVLSGWVYRDILRSEGPMFQGLLVRRDALERVGYLDERIVAFQEWDTAIRLAKRYRFAFAPQPTFVWDRGQPDTISRDFLRSGRGYEQVLRKHSFAILRHCGPRALGRHYRLAARWYTRAGATGASRRCQVLALIWAGLDPRSILTILRPSKPDQLGHAPAQGPIGGAGEDEESKATMVGERR